MTIKHNRRRNHAKPLPLNSFCDQIAVIKPINREENQERLDELQAAISQLNSPPILDFYPSVDAEMKEEEEELKINERIGV